MHADWLMRGSLAVLRQTFEAAFSNERIDAHFSYKCQCWPQQPTASKSTTTTRLHLLALFLRFVFSTMFALLQTVLLALASTSLASPTPKARQSELGPWCDGLGAGAFDVASNFTLAAVYRNLPNANETGVPIILGQAGADDGEEFKVLSVRLNPAA